MSIRQGSVTSVDYENQVVSFTDATAGGNACDLRFDFLVLATGLRRDWPSVPKAFGAAEYVRDALELITQIENSKELPIVVIGGGAHFFSSLPPCIFLLPRHLSVHPVQLVRPTRSALQAGRNESDGPSSLGVGLAGVDSVLRKNCFALCRCRGY